MEFLLILTIYRFIRVGTLKKAHGQALTKISYRTFEWGKKEDTFIENPN